MADANGVWSIDPTTLRDVDREQMKARLGSCTDLERVWILTVLGQYVEAAAAGRPC